MRLRPSCFVITQHVALVVHDLAVASVIKPICTHVVGYSGVRPHGVCSGCRTRKVIFISVLVLQALAFDFRVSQRLIVSSLALVVIRRVGSAVFVNKRLIINGRVICSLSTEISIFQRQPSWRIVSKP